MWPLFCNLNALKRFSAIFFFFDLHTQYLHSQWRPIMKMKSFCATVLKLWKRVNCAKTSRFAPGLSLMTPYKCTYSQKKSHYHLVSTAPINGLSCYIAATMCIISTHTYLWIRANRLTINITLRLCFNTSTVRDDLW